MFVSVCVCCSCCARYLHCFAEKTSRPLPPLGSPVSCLELRLSGPSGSLFRACLKVHASVRCLPRALSLVAFLLQHYHAGDSLPGCCRSETHLTVLVLGCRPEAVLLGAALAHFGHNGVHPLPPPRPPHPPLSLTLALTPNLNTFLNTQ